MRPVTMLLVFVQVATSKRKMCIAKSEFSFHYAVQEHVNEAQMLQIENIHWNNTTKLGCRSTNVKVGIRSVCGVESHTHHVAAVGGSQRVGWRVPCPIFDSSHQNCSSDSVTPAAVGHCPQSPTSPVDTVSSHTSPELCGSITHRSTGTVS